MIRHRSAFVAGLAALLIGSAAPAAEDFARTISDLPLMPGLTEQADTAVVFDKPTGRIVEVAATGPVDPAAVIGFYGRTLPQLGWRQERAALESALFVREGETLTIVVGAPPDGVTTVQFSLSPL